MRKGAPLKSIVPIQSKGRLFGIQDRFVSPFLSIQFLPPLEDFSQTVNARQWLVRGRLINANFLFQPSQQQSHSPTDRTHASKLGQLQRRDSLKNGAHGGGMSKSFSHNNLKIPGAPFASQGSAEGKSYQKHHLSSVKYGSLPSLPVKNPRPEVGKNVGGSSGSNRTFTGGRPWGGGGNRGGAGGAGGAGGKNWFGTSFSDRGWSKRGSVHQDLGYRKGDGFGKRPYHGFNNNHVHSKALGSSPHSVGSCHVCPSHSPVRRGSLGTGNQGFVSRGGNGALPKFGGKNFSKTSPRIKNEKQEKEAEEVAMVSSLSLGSSDATSEVTAGKNGNNNSQPYIPNQTASA